MLSSQRRTTPLTDSTFHAAMSPAASGTIEETVATPKPLGECAWVEARALTLRGYRGHQSTPYRQWARC